MKTSMSPTAACVTSIETCPGPKDRIWHLADLEDIGVAEACDGCCSHAHLLDPDLASLLCVELGESGGRVTACLWEDQWRRASPPSRLSLQPAADPQREGLVQIRDASQDGWPGGFVGRGRFSRTLIAVR
jgi:hypothetical protein